MSLKKRTLMQAVITFSVAAASIIYYFYINDFIDFRALSVGDMNPYGGWSALKSAFTDLSYRWTGLSRSTALTAAISVTALFFGRFFCGYICPIGALQDFLKFIGNKLNIKEIKLLRTKYFNPEMLKYFVLIMALVLSILGLGNILSPVSPWLAYLNIFMGFSFHTGSLFLIIIILISLFVKRVFCRCLCPLGAFQSLLYTVGPFKVHKSNNCKGCCSCLKNCPVDIEYTDDLVLPPECISCSECTGSTCVKGNQGFVYKLLGREVKHYLVICVILFLSIYIIMPLVPSSKKTLLISSTYNLKDGIYSGSGIGFGGSMGVEILIAGNKINDIKIMYHNETSGYYQEVFKEISRKIKETQNLNADAVSGATATSRGYLNAVKDAVSKSLSN